VIESGRERGGSLMTEEDGYGEEGYTVMSLDHYTTEEGHGRMWGVLSFFVGGVVGAGIALLLTPQSGSRTRKRLKEASLGAKDKAEAYFTQVRETVSGTVEKGKDLLIESRPLISMAFQAGKEAYEKEKGRRTSEKTY
jgi:gas vesicle protein